MVRMTLPLGEEHCIQEYKLPDLQSSFQLFGAHLRQVDNAWTYPEHDHPLFEINLVVEGEQMMIVNGKNLHQKAGDLLIIRPGERHTSSVTGDSRMSYFCLHFDIDDTLFRQLLCRSGILCYTSNSIVTERIRPALDQLMDISQRKNPFKITDRMQTLSAAFDLCAGLGESLSKYESHSFNDLQPNLIQFAGRIAELIEEAAEQSTHTDMSDRSGDINHIVQKLGYSMSYCNRIFRRVYGIAPRQYLSAIKLRKAKLLLLDHKLSIEEVASHLGYKDIAHFSRQFKRWTNLSPTHYRQSVNG